jgi:hypothetical protein
MTPAKRAEYVKQIWAFQQNGLIRDSRTSIAAALVFVPKSNLPDRSNDIRIIIDLRAMTEITVRDRFPLPLPEGLIKKLEGNIFFSKLDFYAGYHQGWVASGDVEKTAFVEAGDLWEWLIVSQGISTAPAWLMWMVSEGLKKHTDRDYAIVFRMIYRSILIPRRTISGTYEP